jgi:ethanolamine utilization protein EutN
LIFGEVVGRVWNERQVSGLQGRRLVSVRLAGGRDVVVAVDLVEVAAGNVVLLATDEAAQAAAGGDVAGVDAAVVALVSGADELDDLLRAEGATA